MRHLQSAILLRAVGRRQGFKGILHSSRQRCTVLGLQGRRHSAPCTAQVLLGGEEGHIPTSLQSVHSETGCTTRKTGPNRILRVTCSNAWNQVSSTTYLATKGTQDVGGLASLAETFELPTSFQDGPTWCSRFGECFTDVGYIHLLTFSKVSECTHFHCAFFSSWTAKCVWKTAMIHTGPQQDQLHSHSSVCGHLEGVAFHNPKKLPHNFHRQVPRKCLGSFTRLTQ